MSFCFGDIVVVEGNLIGVVVKSWIRDNKDISHEVYVRSFNTIKEYSEKDIKRYMVRHKELSNEEMEYQHDAENPFISDEEVKDFLNKINWKNL